MEESNQPLFSICIVLWDFAYMASWTLESILRQSCTSYEVLILEKNPSDVLKKMAQNQEKKITFLECKEQASLGDLLNQAIAHATGKYIHILQPGDFYLSQLGLQHIADIIQENPDSDLIYCAHLMREGQKFPSAVSYPLTDALLRKGKLPTRLQSCWFSKKIFNELGTFDTRYKKRPGLDFLCRVFLKGSHKIFSSKRVIVDYEPLKASSSQVLSYTLETFRIIYRYFGLYRAITWWFLEEHLGFFKWSMRKLKKVFWKG